MADDEGKMGFSAYASIFETDFRNVAIAIVRLDAWILMNVRGSARKIVQLLSLAAEIIILTSLIIGLLSIYALPQLQLRLASHRDGRERPRGTIESSRDTPIGITDESSLGYEPPPNLRREIDRLKTKALSLETAFRRMSFQLRALHTRERSKGKETVQEEEEPADFASEAAGGIVLETPDTASYYEAKSSLSFFGIPLCKPNYWTPRKVIQAWSDAGECWAFRGDRGNVKIQLAHPGIIERVVLEHVSAAGSFTGNVDSAPKEFRITAPTPEGSTMSTETFVYDRYGPSSQMFRATDYKFRTTIAKIVTLEILSNWGNPNYTCVYRVRIHGRISP